MKIAILTLGTRGDVQPYAVLGQALKAQGHDVTLSTAKNFEQLALSYGIGFLPVDADFQAILESPEGKKMLKANPFAIRRNLNTWIYPLITGSLAQFFTLAKESDLVLYHVKTLADAFADQFPGKMVRASVLPVVEPTTEFANPSLSGLPIPAFLNRFSYRLSTSSIKLLSKPIGEFRSKFHLPKKFQIPAVKNVYGLSPSFLPVPKDYPATSKFNGFWFGDSHEDLSPDLIAFLENGEAPLVVTFGSMPFKSRFDIQKAISKIVEQLKTRVIIVKGWGFENTEEFERNENIKVIAGAPYDKLFPRVNAIIHHGGIGTTSECLRAGKPFMICPVLYPVGDQFFWGKVAYKHGLSVKPVPLKKMTAQTFIASISELLNNEELYRAAEEMKLRIQQENGLVQTIKYLEEMMQEN